LLPQRLDQPQPFFTSEPQTAASAFVPHGDHAQVDAPGVAIHAPIFRNAQDHLLSSAVGLVRLSNLLVIMSC
jgi:hypothetical protein